VPGLDSTVLTQGRPDIYVGDVNPTLPDKGRGVGRNDYFSNQTFDIRGIRNGTKPLTSDRTACTFVSDPNGST
jgi:hypothetical protein